MNNIAVILLLAVLCNHFGTLKRSNNKTPRNVGEISECFVTDGRGRSEGEGAGERNDLRRGARESKGKQRGERGERERREDRREKRRDLRMLIQINVTNVMQQRVEHQQKLHVIAVAAVLAHA